MLYKRAGEQLALFVIIYFAFKFTNNQQNF